MPIGATFLERWPVREEPGRISWRAGDFECLAPATFILRDVIVHSSAGLIQIGQDVVAETLASGDPYLHGYRFTNGGIDLTSRTVRHLPGTHVTVLCGNKRNYFHAVLDGIARLVMLPDYYIQLSAGLLHADGAVAQAEGLDHLGLPANLARIPVRNDEALHISELIFPWDLYGLSSFHPCVMSYFDRISSRVHGDGSLPRRIYIDRRASPLRRLLNEDDVVTALAAYGFVAIRPETLRLSDQVRLFRGAEAIIAPHGAALTNLGFCRPGCTVLELHMDAYVHWCFRHLGAVRGVSYDCVLGRATAPWPAEPHLVHALGWRVHVPHVIAAALHMLG